MKYRIEIQGSNIFVIDNNNQIWCLQINNELGKQRCEEYIQSASQIVLEAAE